MNERVLCCGESAPEVAGVLAFARTSKELSGAEIGQVAAPDTPSPAAGPGTVYRPRTAGYDGQRPDHLAAAVVAAAQAFHPTLILAGPSKRSREALARASAVLDAPAITGVKTLVTGPDGPLVSREFLSGNAVSEERVSGRPAGLALAELLPATPGGATSSEEVELEVALPSYSFERTGLREKPSGGVRLEDAPRIVSVGRGLQKREDLAIIEALARALDAAVGCTRPLAAEAGWLSDDHWVGLTGHRVRPALYVAIGISGAVQHLVGMRESKVVVAINKDPNAPIFAQADYRIVGDLYQVVPALTRRLAGAARAPG